MLADSVEAAVKGHNKPFADGKELSDFIIQVIRSKVEAQQLNDVDFTMREMSLVAEAFMEVLRSTYHSREVKNIEEIIKEAKLKRGEQVDDVTARDMGAALLQSGDGEEEKEKKEEDK